MENSTVILDSIDTNPETDIFYREDLKGKVFIANSEQEAAARFDAWMNERTGRNRNLIGVYDQAIGKKVWMITAVYWKSQ